MASQYDTYYEVESHAKADFIQRFTSLTKDDQLVDIGGGTAQISLMIHSDLKMTHPVVCVDPSSEMLAVARENGAITIQATAEEFLASKPDYPLKVVLLNACIHHFTDLDFVCSQLAKYMAEDGVCIVTQYPPKSALPLFKAALHEVNHIGDRYLEAFCKSVESKGLKWRMMSGAEPGEVEKELWYSGIRNRMASVLLKYTDEELEQGIQELQEEFKDTDVIKFDVSINGVLVTH